MLAFENIIAFFQTRRQRKEKKSITNFKREIEQISL